MSERKIVRFHVVTNQFRSDGDLWEPFQEDRLYALADDGTMWTRSIVRHERMAESETRVGTWVAVSALPQPEPETEDDDDLWELADDRAQIDEQLAASRVAGVSPGSPT